MISTDGIKILYEYLKEVRVRSDDEVEEYTNETVEEDEITAPITVPVVNEALITVPVVNEKEVCRSADTLDVESNNPLAALYEIINIDSTQPRQQMLLFPQDIADEQLELTSEAMNEPIDTNDGPVEMENLDGETYENTVSDAPPDFTNFSTVDFLKYIAINTHAIMKIAVQNQTAIKKLETHVYAKKKIYLAEPEKEPTSITVELPEPEFDIELPVLGQHFEQPCNISSLPGCAITPESNMLLCSNEMTQREPLDFDIEQPVFFQQSSNMSSLPVLSTIDPNFFCSNETTVPAISLPTSTPKRKRSRDDCVQLIKKLLSQEYTKDELARGSFTSGTKKYKGKELTTTGLSPCRLKKVLSISKKEFPKEFMLLNTVKVINEKCRKTRLYRDKNNL